MLVYKRYSYNNRLQTSNTADVRTVTFRTYPTTTTTINTVYESDPNLYGEVTQDCRK